MALYITVLMHGTVKLRYNVFLGTKKSVRYIGEVRYFYNKQRAGKEKTPMYQTVMNS